MAPRARRFAIVLAGGDGTRLRSLTRAIAGDDRPKEFCRVAGSETLLEQTYRRIETLIAPARDTDRRVALTSGRQSGDVWSASSRWA